MFLSVGTARNLIIFSRPNTQVNYGICRSLSHWDHFVVFVFVCACVFVVGRGYTVFMLSVHLFALPLLFGAFFFSELFFFRREGHFFWLPITFFGWENKNKSECFVFESASDS